MNSRYRSLMEDIAAHCKACGRDPSSVTLLTVSKNHPWEEAAPFYTEGCRDFGENRVQELLEKLSLAPPDVRWHLIGTLQRKKVAKLVGVAALIHSVDSLDLAQRISEVSAERGLVSAVLLQVNTSGEESKHGFSPAELRAAHPALRAMPGLCLEGLMTMAPLTEDEAVIRACFADLRRLRDELGLRELSMGMSHDYPIAIQEGATILRVGSALFMGASLQS
ncbi:MAG: YggS family pyridoxal phosphate-dependent enzyme [Chlamydiia bacterium]|nr:YggS family pyridoxal phosphate-dependent enzyme [Chlamydiia bacterium]